MRIVKLSETREFTPDGMKRFFLVENSEFFKIINFNLAAGATFPVHSHDLDGELSIQVLEGKVFSLERERRRYRPEKVISSFPRFANLTGCGLKRICGSW